jgi:nucleotidyltransferase substrate binding protein (TIGR01987 family)
MEDVKIKFEVLTKALVRFEEAIAFFQKIKSLNPTLVRDFDYELLYQATRDSVIQRFEFSVELFWKYLKIYLGNVKNVKLEINTPKDVMREGCKARILSEQEAEDLINMLKSRNQTSHIYKEEIAEQLVLEIPKFYVLIQKCVERIKC